MRRRFDRFVRVKLSCGHETLLNSGRYRVSKALASCLFGFAVRRGAWYIVCNGMDQPVEMLGVERGDLGGGAVEP